MRGVIVEVVCVMPLYTGIREKRMKHLCASKILVERETITEQSL